MIDMHFYFKATITMVRYQLTHYIIKGFRGTIYVGYVGILPNWVTE
jgi:hypothetical protein